MARRLDLHRPTIQATVAMLSALAALTATGCGKSSPSGPSVLRVEIAPGAVQVARGATVGLSATAIWDAAAPTDVGPEATWSSSNPAVAEVAGSRVVGRSPGTAVVTAAWSGHAATALVTVTPAALVAVQVEPSAAFLPAGTTRRFTATGVYTDATTADLSAAATWSSSADGVAAVVGGAAPATLRGAAAGAATLTATVEGKSGTAAVTVGAPALESLRVEPPSAQVPVGLGTTFSATGVYSDGTTADLTAEVLWSVEGGVAHFPSASTGAVLGLAEGGPVRVRAVLPGDGAAGEASLTVTAATVVAVDVTPAAATLPRGLTRAFTATAVYSDGHHGDVTGQVTWSSSDAGLVSVSSAPATAGTAAAVAAGGPVTLTAELAAAGVAGHADVTVTAAVVTAVEVAPAVATVAAGRTLPFSATALLSDGQRQPATEDVAWTSADPGLASISNVPGARGLASGLRAGGPVTVRAQLPGLAAPGEAALTVSGAELVALTVEPSAASLAAGTALQLRATGRYADGTVADLTGLVAWSSADAAVADVQAGAAAAGRVLAVAPGGPVAVTARLAGAAVQGDARVTVTPAVLVSLAVSPAAARAPLGRGVAFAATGTFSDGSTQDLTRQVSWLSGDDAVATVSNAYGAAGFAQSRAEGGPVEVRAWFPGTAVSAAASFAVDPAALVSLAVSPASVSLPAGRAQPLQALGTYTDGGVRDLTVAAAWTSAAPATVAPQAAPGSFRGVAAGGPVAVTARVDGLSAACAFTVLPPVVERVEVAPPVLALEWGAAATLAASATFSDGSVQDVTAGAAWSAAVPGVVRLQLLGGSLRVSGAWLGATAVTAAFGGASGSASVSVGPALPVALRLLPGTAAVGVGGQVQLRALGTYADGTLLDVTGAAAWSTSAPAVATVPQPGQVHGLAPGEAAISATLGATGSAPVVVTAQAPARSLASLVLEGARGTLRVGGAAQLRATGWYDDGTSADLTAAVTWSSVDPGVATVDAAGLARGVAAGTTPVTAAHAASGLVATAPLTVTGADEVVALTVEGPALVAPNAMVQLRAVGRLASGATVDLTSVAAWVPVSGSAGIAGPGRFLAAPPALRVAAFWQGLRADLAVPVAAAPDGLRAVPAVLRLAPGAQGVVHLLARTSGAEPEEDAVVGTCTSSAPAVISCDTLIETPFEPIDVPSMQGCNAGSLGSATLTCTAGGRTAEVAVTVSAGPPPEAITDVFIRPSGWFGQWLGDLLTGRPEPLLRAPTWPALRPGDALALDLLVVTDAGRVEVTSQADWTSTDPRVAAHAGGGVFRASAPGGFAVLADLAGATAAERLVVIGAPAASGLVIDGRPGPFSAGEVVGLRGFTAGPEGGTDVTAQLAWSSSDPAVASFSTAEPGVLRTHAAGTATVTAVSRDGATATREVAVVGVAALRLVPSRLELSPDRPFGVAAIARLSDGTPRLVNDGATWTVGDPAVLESLAEFQLGAFMGLAPGATRVEAAFGDLTGGADVVITDSPAPGALDAVAIREVPVLLAGERGTVLAEAWYTDGQPQPVGPGWTVTTSDPAVVAVLDLGGQPVAGGTVVLETPVLSVVGLAEGVATITVTEPGGAASDAAPVHVTSLRTLEIRPGAVSVGAGGTVSLSAVGIDGRGRERGLAATWSVADPAVAAFADPTFSDLFGLAPGTTTVTASAAGLSATATVEVTAPRPAQVLVEPAPLVIELGQVAALHARGVAADGSAADVTAAATWHTLDPAVAAFEAPGAPGLVAGRSVGEADVVATLAVDGRTLAGPGHVSVRAALQALAVEAGSGVAGRGATVQARAIASWGDGSQPSDATSWVAWDSSDHAVLAPVPGQPGAFLAVATGPATLTAASPSGVVGSLAVTVLPPFPVGLGLARQVAGPVRIGETAAYTAEATLSDGTTADVTAAVAWLVPAGAVVTGPGQVRVDAWFPERLQVMATLATPAGELFADDFLDVVAPVAFVDVLVDPGQVWQGDGITVLVRAIREDGQVEDVTALAPVAFSPDLATPTGTPGQYLLTGSGTVQVSATFEGVTGAAFLEVQPVPVSIAIDPVTITVEEGQQAVVSATATLSDGSTVPLFFEADWGTTGPEAFAQPGAVFGQFPGTTELTVAWTLGPVVAVGRATVTVLPRPVALTIAPDDQTVGVGDPAAYTATLTFTDGSTRDVTAETGWFSFDGALAPGASPGTFQAAFPGFFEVQASWNDRLFDNAFLRAVEVPTGLALTLPAGVVFLGDATPIVAVATMSGGSTIDVSSQVAWTSDDPAVAVVEAGLGGQWLVAGVGPGLTTLRATWTEAGHTVEAFLHVSVLDVPVSLHVAPQTVLLAAGGTAPLTVQATMASGALVDASPGVAWSSTDAGVAVVGPGAPGTWRVIAGSPGVAFVRATWTGPGPAVWAEALVSVTLPPPG